MARLAAEQTKICGKDMVANGSLTSAPSTGQDAASRGGMASHAGGRASTRPQGAAPHETAPIRPSEPTPVAGLRLDPLGPISSRRRQSSFRDQTFSDQRATLAPTQLQASPSKRSALRPGVKPPHGRQASFNSPPLQNRTYDEHKSKNLAHTLGNKDFLPSVNFDDFHTSLKTDRSLIDAFPAPRGEKDAFSSTVKEESSGNDRPSTKGNLKSIGFSEGPSRIRLNGSSLRRQNSVNPSSTPATSHEESSSSYVPTAATRARRKTYFPSSINGMPGNRPPRKSVGPGILTGAFERPSLAQIGLGEETSSHDPSGLLPPLQTSNLETARRQKAKSFQSPKRGPDQPSTPNGTSIEVDPSIAALTPGRSTGQRTTTPSSNKRLSVMPNSAHATGLAARTISPTDARRIKRMSMMPNPPPLPATPSAVPPEPSPSVASHTVTTPAVMSPNCATPSSSRTTPELNRKSYSSGVSNSSNTSYNSVTGPHAPNRISQSLSASRLPTLKNRGEQSGMSEDEFVPPVPAIPKAYESPKTEVEQVFFPTQENSSVFDEYSLESPRSTEESIQQEVGSFPMSQERFAFKRPDNVNGPSTERKPAAANSHRRTLQPLRLPPLNLLPLSTPTTSKIASIADGSTVTRSRTITPPPRSGAKAVPTTPMTASKASLAKNYYLEEAAPMPPQMRSSSSHHIARSDVHGHRTPSSSSNQPPTPIERYATPASRAAISPFISSSLPKTSNDFGPLRREMSNPVDFDARPSRLTGPRLQKSKKTARDDASSVHTASSVDNATHSIGNSIRRRLSLSRKRSSSKTRASAETDGAMPRPSHEDMPPPRLPASATWNGPFLPSSAGSTHNSFPKPVPRNVSDNSASTLHDRQRMNTWDMIEPPVTEARKDHKRARGMPGDEKPRTARSILEGPQDRNALSLKDFLREAKNIDPPLDRDDLMAEEEMKKLAAKRKESDHAAKEVDALQRRATAKERRSPSSALQLDRQKSRRRLNTFEIGEIVDYKDTFFVGADHAAKHVGDLNDEAGNFGYDDERGDYNIVNGDHLAYRYEIVDILGKGSFGQVVRCIDHKTGGLVAIKIIRNKKRFHQQALVEVDILQKLREWDPYDKHSMVNFTQSFYFRGHLCISTELLGMNLYEFIKCHEFRGFSIKLIRRFAKQLLSSLVLLKGKKVIHCDLKPENILLAHPAHSEIKVIDFGSSCLENEKVYTYIQSRFYRSPEVILGMTYGMPIDMWSLGCILAELLTGYPIFPGEDEREQLACIMEIFGPPEKHLIEKSTRKKLFFDSLGKPRITVSSKGKRRRPSSKSLQQALKCDDEAFLDFIARCLRWDPDRRLKPDEAMLHEFITSKPAKHISTRPRTAPSNPSASPIKRYNSVTQTPANSVARPLPEPPATSSKANSGLRNGISGSATVTPMKPAAIGHAKRHSNITSTQINNMNGASNSVKKPPYGNAMQGSALPRVTSTGRATSGMVNVSSGRGVGAPDMAAAAAAVSLAQKTR